MNLVKIILLNSFIILSVIGGYFLYQKYISVIENKSFIISGTERAELYALYKIHKKRKTLDNFTKILQNFVLSDIEQIYIYPDILSNKQMKMYCIMLHNIVDNYNNNLLVNSILKHRCLLK